MTLARTALLVIAAILLGLVPALRAQPLPADPRLVMGELENGLRYIIRRHANPPQRAAIWLHVSAGSFNETEAQRGLAHFLEHMAFNGSENYPAGTVVPLFESLGLTFGHDQNAFTSFDQTVYTLALPDTKPETLDKALLFLADVAGRLTLAPEEIEKERQVILEERRAHLGSRQRIRDYVLERLAPGSLIGVRLPIGTEETIKSVARDDFRDYYTRWYVPANMTVIAVADLEPAALLDGIRRHFGGFERRPRPEDPPVGVTPYEQNRAIVAADPELTSAEISLTWLFPPRPPTTSIETYRDRLTEQVGIWIVNRRLQNRILRGEAAFQSASVDLSDLFQAARTASAGARGDPAQWRRMLTDLAIEVQRARLHGFTEEELADARAQYTATAERAAASDESRPASSILSELASAVQDGDTPISAAQHLEIIRALLPQITAAQVHDRFRAFFDASRPLTFILEIPTTAEVPTEEQLVALGVEALAVEPPPEAARTRASALLEEVPEPGPIADLVEDAASGVWSAWIGGNVRLHYRFMDYRKDQVGVLISLAGSELKETAENRGVSQAAAAAWARPATSTLASNDIRDLLTGKKIGVRGQATSDTLALAISGSPDDLETGFQVAYLLLTDPVLEPAAFDQWRDQTKRAIAQRKLAPLGAFTELLARTLYPPEEVRLRPLEAEQVDRLTREQAQAWLREHTAFAPIEVAIVGDVSREKAIDLARRYLGSLSHRERISSATLDDRRGVQPRPGPLEAHERFVTQTEHAVAMVGFIGAPIDRLEDVRLLNIAARILSSRAIERIRESAQLAYSPSVSATAGTEYPNLGMVGAASQTAPGRAAELIAAFDALFADFASSGPTPEEMDTVRKQLAAAVEEQLREPAYWLQMLGTLDYRGRTIASILEAREAYQQFSAEEVKEGFNRYYKPERMFRLSITPETPAAPQPRPASDR